MSQLHRFLSGLNSEELKTVKEIRLIGREKNLFDLTLSHIHAPLPEPEDICAKLEITSAHLYKINSVLLTKAYAALVPEGGLKLMEFLKYKGQFILIRSEARSQEKQLLQLNPGKNILERFYLGLFHIFIDFPFRFYDRKLVDEFGIKYLESKQKRTESDDLYVRYHKLFAEVNRCAAMRNPTRSLLTDMKEEMQKENELKKGKHFLALYYLHRAEASWFTLYEPNQQKKLSALEKAIALKDKIAWFFEVDIGNFLQLLYADALFTGNDPEQAYAVYSRVFGSGVKENMYGYYYFCEQYILLKIIMHEFDSAESLLERIFAGCIKQQIDIFATRGALAYAKLHLARGEFKEAIQFINSGYAINEKNFYLPFEVQLRLLESIAFAGKEDFDFALKLCRRNIKFAESSEDRKLLGEYVEFWKNLEELCKARKKEKDAPEETFHALSSFSLKHVNLYCGIPEKTLLRPRGKN